MILHRFCSAAEYNAFARGETLENNTDHGKKRGYDTTTSVGFCFFPENPEDAKHWLSGIVDFDYCLTLDIPDRLLRSSYGRYTAWMSPGVASGVCRRREFCLRQYSIDTVKLIDASTAFRGYVPNASTLRKLFPRYFL